VRISTGPFKHAMRYQAFEGRAIERILGAKATPRTLESVRNERARRELQQALPPITQRPLDQVPFLFSLHFRSSSLSYRIRFSSSS
jgi:hypothetical protein